MTKVVDLAEQRRRRDFLRQFQRIQAMTKVGAITDAETLRNELLAAGERAGWVRDDPPTKK